MEQAQSHKRKIRSFLFYFLAHSLSLLSLFSYSFFLFSLTSKACLSSHYKMCMCLDVSRPSHSTQSGSPTHPCHHLDINNLFAMHNTNTHTGCAVKEKGETTSNSIVGRARPQSVPVEYFSHFEEWFLHVVMLEASKVKKWPPRQEHSNKSNKMLAWLFDL